MSQEGDHTTFWLKGFFLQLGLSTVAAAWGSLEHGSKESGGKETRLGQLNMVA